jgi:hypothetical protein
MDERKKHFCAHQNSFGKSQCYSADTNRSPSVSRNTFHKVSRGPTISSLFGIEKISNGEKSFSRDRGEVTGSAHAKRIRWLVSRN